MRRKSRKDPNTKKAASDNPTTLPEMSKTQSGAPTPRKIVEVLKLDTTCRYEAYAISQVNGRGELTKNGDPFAGVIPAGFDRVVLFHQTNSNQPLLVFDLIATHQPGSAAVAELGTDRRMAVDKRKVAMFPCSIH